MTCFTGKNSESDFRGYGEKFTTLANNGSIGFIGSTGWGFTGSGQTYNEHILRSISIDTIRRIGEILKKASIRMAPDSISSFAVRNTINCFNLLGDPASKLILPVYPDFKITNNDYIVTNKYPNLNESINISFFAKNLGLNADSCKIRFQLLKNGTVNKTKDTVVRNFSFIDTLIYPIKIDTLGSYSAKIMIDVDNWYPQEDPSNNSIIVPITLKNSSLISLKPFDKQVIQSDSVEFVCLNPQTNPLTNNVKIIVQFDTSINFNSGLNQTFFSTSYVSVVSKFKKRIPLLDTNVKYYWRTNVIINNDSVGWSDKKTFSYGIVQKAENNKILNDSNVLLKKDKSTQYFTGEFNRTILNDNNVNIGNFTGTVRPSSFGENVWDPSYFNLNDTSFHILDRTGFIFYKLRKTDAKILDKTHFYFTSTSSPDSLINYLNNFDTTMILVGLKLGVPAGVTTNLTVAARNKIKEFGSTFADNLNSNDWSRWSIVCYKKIPNPIYSEAYVISGWSPAECTLSPDFQRIYGTVAHTFGPAQNWKNFTWEQILFPKSNIKFDVYGINKSNQEILLYSDIANTSGVPLDTVNAYTYPYMKFVTKMSIDTSQTLEPQGLYNGLPSPIFKSISLNITPPSELVIDYNSVVKSDSIIKAGDSVGVSLKYYNVGYKNCYGTVRSLYFYRGIDKVVIFQDTNFSTLKIDSSLSIKKYFTITNEMYPVRRNNEVVQLTFEISPLGQQNDYYDFNNKIPINIVLLSNNVIGNFDIYADGLKLMGGEYVKPQPELTFKYTAKEPNTILLSDSNLFQININNKYFTISNTSKSKIDNSNKRANNNEKSSTDINKKTLQTLQSVTIYPILENGINLIKIFYRSDVFSPFDTIKYSVNVTNELGALDINNYPNPFKDNTVFLFTVTGNRVFDCKIKIFTVAGRLIKTITAPVNIGYNQIYWDGKDDDGDALANGVYFYKLTIEGDTKFISDVQKLVVLK